MNVYCCLRRSTERNEDRIRTLYSSTVSDRIFVRMLSYIFVNDTEIYDRNTEPGISSYFSVYGRIRPWLFDLGQCVKKIKVHIGHRYLTVKLLLARRSNTLMVNFHQMFR